MRALKHIIRVNIINDDTNDRIAAAVGGNTNDLELWPGRLYEPSDDEFASLLGSPSGNGVAWFLSQHKRQLGDQRAVSSIRVWDSADAVVRMLLGAIPCMMFTFNDPPS